MIKESSLNGATLIESGWKPGPIMKHALEAAKALSEKGWHMDAIISTLSDLREGKDVSTDAHGIIASLKNEIDATSKRESDSASCIIDLMNQPAPMGIWGRDAIDQKAIDQINTAIHIPVTAAAALMPDAHPGYGLPIGGVWALRNSVSPYAVGVDIACRMRLSIVPRQAVRETAFEDWVNSPTGSLKRFDAEDLHAKMRNAIISETRFGKGCHYEIPNDHEVMEDPAWNEIPWLRQIKDLAHRQLGSSGGGNHFVEFGTITMREDVLDLGAVSGRTYIALMSHSGSRALGKAICDKYAAIAMEKCVLPDEAKHLAFLSLDSEAGQEYWIAMNLAGRYAAANHEIIHRRVIAAAGLESMSHVENHHNFAWVEDHSGEEVIVHRKGATPAGEGVFGVIPGSRETAGYLVEGLGNKDSLMSASHGAGRCMGRKEAERKLDRSSVKEATLASGVDVISSGLDECPMVYKDIEQVMAAQSDLVRVLGEFRPRIVRMADDGFAED